MFNQHTYIKIPRFVPLIMIFLSACNHPIKQKQPERVSIINNTAEIIISASDSASLVRMYYGSREDRTDTLDWPLPVNDQTVVLIIDVSGTMFLKENCVYKNNEEISFFKYSADELVNYLKKNNFLQNTSAIKIKLFGASPKGKKFTIADYYVIDLPKKKVVITEYFYKSDNNRIDIKVNQVIYPPSFSVYDSISTAIRSLSYPFQEQINNPALVLNESPLLEDIILNREDIASGKGKKCLFYLTDGYFRINNKEELIPGCNIPIEQLKKKFSGLRDRIPFDPSLEYVLYGMNSKENLEFRDKMNAFYRWFLKDTINRITLINLQ